MLFQHLAGSLETPNRVCVRILLLLLLFTGIKLGHVSVFLFFLLTGNTHQLPKHGCVVGLRLPGETERKESYTSWGICTRRHGGDAQFFMHMYVSTHHWQFVKVQQFFYEASEHILTLPHLIQSPESKDHFHKKRGEICEKRVICTYWLINVVLMWVFTGMGLLPTVWLYVFLK